MTKTVLCPAKVNEYLCIGAKDNRGYHPVSTIFQAVGLYDVLTVSDESGQDAFGSDCELPERNTVTRAWDLVKECVKLPPLNVFLKKSIPSQSGLGGGSSDAGGFLRAVSQFATALVDRDDLHEIATAVGADVPFFLVGGRAQGEGYGDKLTELPDEQKRWILIAKPSVGCSTEEMYARLDGAGGREAPTAKPRGTNDFEPYAPPQCTSLIRFLRSTAAEYAGLTGSGSAVYGSFKTLGAAWEVELQLRSIPDPIWTCVAPTLMRQESLQLS